MLTYIANEYKKKQRSLINAVCACASPREAAARGMLEMSLCRRLRKTPTDSSSRPSEEGPLGAAAKESFHNRYY